MSKNYLEPLYYVFIDPDTNYYIIGTYNYKVRKTTIDINDENIFKIYSKESANDWLYTINSNNSKSYEIVPVYDCKKSLVDKIVEGCK
jgi:hypothetical protein